MTKNMKSKKEFTDDEKICNAINPFALGNIIEGKKINWDKEKDPDKKLAEIFGIKDPKVIFKSDSPFLIPRQVKINSKTGKATLNSEETDFDRFQKFVKKYSSFAKTPKATTKGTGVVKGGDDQNTARMRKAMYALFSRKLVNKKEGIVEKEVAKKSSGTKSYSSKDWIPSDIMWKVMGDYMVTSMLAQEAEQGSLGDCYFIAALVSSVWAAPRLLYATTSGSNYVLRFWNKNLKAETVTISQKVAVRKPLGQWLYAQSTTLNETWPAIWEKGFAKWMNETSSDCPDMSKIAGGNPGQAMRRLTGYDYDDYYCKSGNSDKIWKMLVKNTDSNGKAVLPMTTSTSDKNRRDTIGTIPNHAYSVLGIETYNGVKRIIIRNPWGSSPVKMYCRSGTWNGLVLNSYGVFSMEFSKYLEYFNYFFYLD